MHLSFYKQQVRNHFHEQRDSGGLWFFWFLLLPIVPLLAYMCLGFLKIMPAMNGVSRHLFIVIGMTSWLLFSDFLQQPYRGIEKYKSFFLRQEVALTQLLTAWLPERLLAAALQFAFCLVCVVLSVSVRLDSLALYLGMTMLGGIFFLSLGALFGVIGLLAPSFVKLLETSVRFLLFLSAAIFPLPSNAYMDWIKMFNPFYVYIAGSRNALLGLPVDWISVAAWSGVAFMLVLFLKGRLAAITPDVRDYLV